MATNYINVFVKQQDDEQQFQEITPEYVYLTIPADYICIYHKLLIYLANFGKEAISDCSSICKDSNKNIITCWNIFQSAIACRELGLTKQADLFIQYITAQLNNLYNGTDKENINIDFPVTVTDDGKLKAIASCGQETKFYVDIETGQLYEEYINANDNRVYVIENDNLVSKTNDSNE